MPTYVVSNGLVAHYRAGRAKVWRFGNTNAASSVNQGFSDYKLVSKFTLTQSALVSKLTAYISNDGSSHQATYAKALIYSDNAGVPYTRLAVGPAVSVSDGATIAWVDLPLSSPVRLTPGTYWIGLTCPAGTSDGFIYRRDTGQPANSSVYENGTYTNPESPFDNSKGMQWESTTYACYATFSDDLPGNNTDPTSTWKDLAGSNDGTLTNFGWTTSTGWAGSGTPADPYRVVFAGTDDAVSAGDWSVGEDKTYSYEVWFKSVSGVSGYLIADVSSVNSGSRDVTYIQLNGTTLVCGITDESYNNANITSAGVTCNDGNWHHAVHTCDGSNLNIYIDGVSRATPVSIAGVSGSIVQDQSSIGYKRGQGTSDFFIGSVAAARVYNRALSAAEVAQNYAAGVNGDTLPDRSSLIVFGIA